MDECEPLLRRCQEGDESALLELVRSHQDAVYRLAYRVVGDSALAEEATVAAFYKIWTKAAQWRGEASATTWVYRIVVRTVLDIRRGQRRWWKRWAAPLPEALADSQPEPVSRLTQAEDVGRRNAKLQQALGQLSEADRALVHLYYFESRSLSELEAILGVARATLKTRLTRARQQLRSLLELSDES